ncbi:hypothetical protein D3C77_684760 [compost metagenome]
MRLHRRFRLPAGTDRPAVAVLGAAVDQVGIAARRFAQGFDDLLQLLAQFIRAAGGSLHLHRIDHFVGHCSHS